MYGGMVTGLAMLGLISVDPIGIAVMPLLLIQRHPVIRCTLFLMSSFLALVAWGVLFSLGGGHFVLSMTSHAPWTMPFLEMTGGIALGFYGLIVLARKHASPVPARQSLPLARFSQLTIWQLMLVGMALVSTQSVLDVVFVIAMIRLGQADFAIPSVMFAVVIYALAALCFQVMVVILYAVTPQRQRQATLRFIRHFVDQAGNRFTVIISLVLAVALIINGALAFSGHPHL